MQKKLSTNLLFSALILFSFAFSAPLFAESASDRLDDLNPQREVNSNTLNPPLLLGALSDGLVNVRGSSLLQSPFEAGHSTGVNFEQVGETGFHLRYKGLNEPANFFWIFEEKLNLSNRWLQIIYSSLAIPETASLVVGTESKSDSVFKIAFEDSVKPRAAFFKLPGHDSFSKIEKISIEFPEDKNGTADFMILDLKLLPEGETPFKGVESGNLGDESTQAEQNYANFMG